MTFSKPPRPSVKARPVSASLAVDDALPGYVDLFKRTYVLERRVLDTCRLGPDAKVYHPAKSLDGGNRYNTPEEKEKKNQWVSAYQTIASVSKPRTPIEYVRILFYSLRASSLATPTVLQLATADNQKTVEFYANSAFSRIQAKFITDATRAKTEIVLRTSSNSGTRQSMPDAVYCSLLDSRLELSPLFRYCLAVDTLQKAEGDRKSGVNMDFNVSRMKKYVKSLEFLAAFDYTVFPDVYDSVYGASLPSGFKKLALSLVESARDA